MIALRAEHDAVTRSARITLGLVVSMAFMASSRSHLASQTLKPAPTFDREYTLEHGGLPPLHGQDARAT